MAKFEPSTTDRQARVTIDEFELHNLIVNARVELGRLCFTPEELKDEDLEETVGEFIVEVKGCWKDGTVVMPQETVIMLSRDWTRKMNRLVQLLQDLDGELHDDMEYTC
jgi:hypothetical protein